ncbi:putative short chain dehydrogenase [Microthyrium microscopicum]|uniref:Putative short chain dehydrogenase n=1 Tax=Microthyrium microscopicum TaxID=703497 RepID=A0A6A6TWD7_9PEZI|nr:putative short chain dehydrogenase [Microthyrium microscopicum]
MPSYLITGTSRGIGYEFARQLAQDKSNTVIGLVRNKVATDERLAKDGITNVTIYEADITDFPALQKSAAEVAKLTGGNLDYLINNAASVSTASGYVDLTHYENNAEELNKELSDAFQTNVIGVANTVTAFLPLIKKSTVKKIITISSGMADIDLINSLSLGLGAPYSISKAATNALVAKYNAAFGSEGILFMSISPGLVDSSEGKTPTPEQLEKLAPMIGAFAKYKPEFAGPISTKDSVEHVMKLVERATVKEFGGAFVSHFGTKEWL